MEAEWTTVATRRRGVRRRPQAVRASARAPPEEPFDPATLQALVAEVERSADRLRSLCRDCLSALRTALNAHAQTQTTLVCYGIGRIAESSSALLQFALAVALRRNLALTNCTCFDPLFGRYEIDLCKHFGFEYDAANTCGKTRIQGGALLFMPHCPHRLYCNALWAHRASLSRLLILGNSFESYNLRRSDMDPTDTVRLLRRVTSETPLLLDALEPSVDSLAGADRAFNDTSLMSFASPDAALAWPSEEELDAATALDLEVF